MDVEDTATKGRKGRGGDDDDDVDDVDDVEGDVEDDGAPSETGETRHGDPLPSSSHAPARTALEDQPLNASTIFQTAMGLRGKDRHRITGRDTKEEGALVMTAGGSRDEDEDDPVEHQDETKRKWTKKGSFWRSRGMVLFTVFMALLLDETLMTVIVPIVPDYLLNNCVVERCSGPNVTALDCPGMTTYPQDSTKTTTTIWGQTLTPTSPGNRSDVVMSTPIIMGGATMASEHTDSGLEGSSATPPSAATRTAGTNGFGVDFMTTSLSPPTTSPTRSDVPPSSSSTTTSTAPSVEEECEEEVVPKTGILFASKFYIRIILSPIVGSLAHKPGFSLLLLSGCFIMAASCVVFALGVSYEALLTARVIHGVGATLNEIGGLGLIAYKYRHDEKGRGFALGVAIGGFAAGTLIGPPLGGFCYDFLGKESPFLIMVGFFAVLVVLELVTLNPRRKQHQVVTKGSPVWRLVKDPYILVTCGALMLASGMVAILEPTLPIWMRNNIKPPPDAWQLGAVFMPSGLAYIISSTIMGYLGYKIGRWLVSMLALVVLAVSVASFPYTGTFLQLVGPMVGTGIGSGTVDSAMTAMLNSRVDSRHKGAYGGAAAMSTLSFCLGYAIGPSISGFLTNAFGFKWLMRGMAVVTLAYAPICIALRRPGNASDVSTSNGYAPGTQDDVIDDVGAVHVPSISRRLSRV